MCLVASTSQEWYNLHERKSIMTLTLELPAAVELSLQKEAKLNGITVEALALNKLHSRSTHNGQNSILALAERIWAKYPEIPGQTLPEDYAINHDHYIHGAPKVEP